MNQKGLLNTLVIILIVIVIAGVAGYFIFFQKPEFVPTTPTPSISNNRDDDVLVKKKNAIELEYPEFKNFEIQKSFAGQSIKQEMVGSDYYFAYIVHGSGLPIVQATCFRVDRNYIVSKVGAFPNPTDSYVGYRDINAKNCGGIK